MVRIGGAGTSSREWRASPEAAYEGQTMDRFYISAADPESDVRRCEISRDTKTPITISGESENDGIGEKAFSGIVLAVLDLGMESPQGRRWRVTIE